MGWGEINLLLMSIILIPCVGFLMSKSRRMVEVFLVCGVWDWNSMPGVVPSRYGRILGHPFNIISVCEY
jgi:hypothetical protein